MKLDKILNSKLAVVGAVALVGAVAVIYAGNKAKVAAKKTGDAINPINQENIFYTGVNAVGEKITGKPFSLGGWLYNVTH